MRRVLIVAYYFPPIAGIGSIRLGSFARYLPEFGWEPTVLAPRNTPHPADPSIPLDESRVVRSRSIEPSRIARALAGPQAGGDGAATRSARTRATVKRLLYPDPQVGWYPGAMAAGRRTLRGGSFDAVFSSSFPITGHLVARSLSRRAQVPWIAEYRDPWSGALEPGHPNRARAERLEARIAAEAAAVVMPTPTWAAHFGALWKTDVKMIMNGHELSDSDQAPTEPTLTHLGSFYPDRATLAPLWDALADIKTRQERLPRVRFIGDLDSRVREEAIRAGLGGCVEVTGALPHEHAVREMGRSSLLIACGQVGESPIARGWIPAKLFEYLATSSPILYLGERQGDAGRLLASQPGCFVAGAGEPEALDAALRAGLRGERVARDVSQLTRRAGAERLATLLEQVTGPRNDQAIGGPEMR